MTLQISTGQLKAHFNELGFIAAIDDNAPREPWDHHGVTLRHASNRGVVIVISVSIYTREVATVERRVEGGREGTVLLAGRLASIQEEDSIGDEVDAVDPFPHWVDDTTDVKHITTLEELTELALEQIVIRDMTSEDTSSNSSENIASNPR